MLGGRLRKYWKTGVKVCVCKKSDLIKEKTTVGGKTFFQNQLTKKLAPTKKEAGTFPPPPADFDLTSFITMPAEEHEKFMEQRGATLKEEFKRLMGEDTDNFGAEK